MTNRCLSNVFICPFDCDPTSSWSVYAVSQHKALANLHKWLRENQGNVDLVFFTNLFKDFCPSILIHFPTIRIAGLVHGCASDPAEPGASQQLLYIEKSLSAVSSLCVSSHHLLNKLKMAGYPVDNARVTGLPLDANVCARMPIQDRPRLCIFNHRLVREKGIHQLREVWQRITRLVPDAKCIVTYPWADPESLLYVHQVAKAVRGLEITRPLASKEYERVVGNAAVGFSLALYENFGTSFAYSLLRRVCYFVPDRLSYVELAPRALRYSDHDELAHKVAQALVDRDYRQSMIDLGIKFLLENYQLRVFLKKAGFKDA